MNVRSLRKIYHLLRCCSYEKRNKTQQPDEFRSSGDDDIEKNIQNKTTGRSGLVAAIERHSNATKHNKPALNSFISMLMEELVIASNNPGKIREIRSMIDNIKLLSLKDIGFDLEIPEPYDTFEQNAYIKAETIHRFSGKNVFADDSGICVPALNGEPGVFSARYAGATASDEDNLQKLLAEMATPNKSGQATANRSAYYKAVICLIWNGDTHYFEGVCQGRLTDEKRGTGGFGYDPIFVPDGYEQTFAELPLDIKNNISHRGKAVRAMVAFLNEQTGK